MNIFEAARDGYLTRLKQARAEKVNLETTKDSEYGSTLLHWAVFGKQIEILQYLLSLSPVRIDYTNKANKTPADFAETGSVIQQLLINYQRLLLQPVFDTYSSSIKNGCRFNTLRLKESMFIEKNRNGNDKEHRYDSVHANIEHHSKKRPVELKHSFDLKPIHNELAANLNSLPLEEGGNKVLAALTFEIKTNTGRFAVSIPVRASGMRLFNRTHAEEAAGGERIFLRLLNYYYNMGRTIGEVPTHVTHGTHPDYSVGAKSAHQQFINHSEQALAVYLSTPAAANYFVNSLRAHLRGKDLAALASEVKIYSIILHIHSTKTACPACEFVLTGLMSPNNTNINNFGLIHQFQQAFTQNRDYFRFTFPSRQKIDAFDATPGLRLFTTYSADFIDKTHSATWDYTLTNYNDFAPSIIETQDRDNSRYVYICKFRHDTHKRQHEFNLTEYSIFASASESNKASPERLKAIVNRNETESKDLSEKFWAALSLEPGKGKKGITKIEKKTTIYSFIGWKENFIPQRIIDDFDNGIIMHMSSIQFNGRPLRLVNDRFLTQNNMRPFLSGNANQGKIHLILRAQGG